MLTTTVSRLAPRTRCGSKGTPGSVAPTCAALIRYRGQQSRAFRLGRIWTSHVDPELHHNVFRYHRKLRHKYAETLSRRLSWENHNFIDDAKKILKTMMRDCWRKDFRPACRHVNTHARRRTPDNPTGVRPGRNIEDVERGPIENILFGNGGNEEWFYPFQRFGHRAQNQHRSSSAPAAVSTEDAKSTEVEYVFDPITNRKVPRRLSAESMNVTSSAGVEIPVTTFKGYEQQFTPFSPLPVSDSQEPIFYDGPPPEEELKEYGPVKIDTTPWKSAECEQPSSVFESQEYENNHANSSKKSVFWHANMGISRGQAREESSFSSDMDHFGYKDLHEYIDSTPTEREPHATPPKREPASLEQDDTKVVQQPRQYSDLTSYNSFTYLEPGGRPVEEYTESPKADNYQDSGYAEASHDQSTGYDEPQVHPRERYSYRPFDNEPDVKSAPFGGWHGYDPKEVQSYQAFRYNEPDGKHLSAEEVHGYDAAEVKAYRQVSCSERDGDMANGQRPYNHNEVEQYRSVMYNEPDGAQAEQLDSAAQAPGEFDREQKAGRHIPYLEPTDEERAEDLDLLRASDVRSKMGIAEDSEQSAETKVPKRTMLESSMSRHAATSDMEDQAAAASVRQLKQSSLDAPSQTSKVERQLTGNYVRDFPEEFTRSWAESFTPEQRTGTTPSTDSTLLQPALDREEVPKPIQPVLNRQAESAEKRPGGDLFSKEPQGLETAYAEECGGAQDSAVFVKQYGDIAAQPESANAVAIGSTSPLGATTAEPTVYKILAYDATMQTINIAETTSNVSKTEPPLTPAEVLLRLSNPAKFFPHFAPLQAQGFEIVSGSGVVLVFRKVRDPAPISVAEPVTSRQTEPSTPPAGTEKEAPVVPLVNPIDMTGSRRREFPDPAIGRFASPTGFVNYDMPTNVPQAEPVRRFVSGIDVRREEPVFSGEKKGERGGREKGIGLPKRMAIGAAWVAGVSYALGVMGEYFKTGGADGLGPRGF